MKRELFSYLAEIYLKGGGSTWRVVMAHSLHEAQDVVQSWIDMGIKPEWDWYNVHMPLIQHPKNI